MVAIRSPAMMTGMARGSSTRTRVWKGGHAAAPGRLDVLTVHLQDAGVGVFQHREHGVHAEGHDHRGIGAAPPDEEHPDEHQAGNGLEDGQDRDDDAGEPAGDAGEQDPQHQARRKADDHGHHHEHRVYADGLQQLRAVIRKQGPDGVKQSCHLESPHRFSATLRATLVLVTMPAMVSSAFEHHHVVGAGVQQVVEALLGLVSHPDGPGRSGGSVARCW